MRKRWKSVTLAASLALLLAVPMTASAEDRQGASGWQVSFDGKKMESNFTSGGMNDEVNAMQPGDSVELTVTLKNDFNGSANWYMKNEVLQSLEDAGDAAGGAYDYLLTYTDAAGETSTLYSSEKFGGEGRIGGVGLHGATTTLEDYFFLEQMEGGVSGVVKLKVALDGETLVNDYQNTLARLQMDFATELVVAGGSGTPGTSGGSGGNGNGSGSGTSGGSGKAIKTGDEAEVMKNLIILFGSGLVLLVGGLLLLRRQREEEISSAAGNEAAEATAVRRRRR